MFALLMGFCGPRGGRGPRCSLTAGLTPNVTTEGASVFRYIFSDTLCLLLIECARVYM